MNFNSFEEWRKNIKRNFIFAQLLIINQNLFIMKKLLLSFALLMSILFTANAGYIVRGIRINTSFDDLKNYTLTFDQYGDPIAATSLEYPTVGWHCIAIIKANSNTAHIFPNIADPRAVEIIVRDFHWGCLKTSSLFFF